MRKWVCFFFMCSIAFSNLSFSQEVDENDVLEEDQKTIIENTKNNKKTLNTDSEKKKTIGIRIGMELRNGDLLHICGDNYRPEFNTNIYYTTDLSKYGIDWVSFRVGMEFNLSNIGYYAIHWEEDPASPGQGAKMSDDDGIEASMGVKIDYYKDFYLSFVFNTDNWLGFYIGWDKSWKKHSLDVRVGTQVLWNPAADLTDVYDRALYNHMDEPFSIYAVYSYLTDPDVILKAGLGFVLPYALNEGSDYFPEDASIFPTQRLDLLLGLKYEFFDFLLTLRTDFYTGAFNGYKAGEISFEPRVAFGFSF